jgi:FixJ family two-component response regulator
MALIGALIPGKRVDSGRRQLEETQLQTALIAVVDDDKWIRKSLQRLLKSAGFRVETFASAEDYLRNGGRNKTACMLLDVRLPGMNGFDLVRQLAAEHKGLPIVFMSAHDEPMIRSRALEVRTTGFLSKPMNEESLLEAVTLALKRAQEDPKEPYTF